MASRGHDQELARRNVSRAMKMADPPLSTAALARRADVDVKTVRGFLGGQRWPHSDTLAKLDRALDQPEGTIEAWASRDEEFLLEHAPAEPDPVITLDDASELELVRALLARIEARS